jgi:hypothetical protein
VVQFLSQGFARAGIVPVDATVFSQYNAGQYQGHHRSWIILNIEKPSKGTVSRERMTQKQCCESGSGAFLASGSGMGKNPAPDPGSGLNIQDHFSESLETFLGLKILKFFDEDPDPESGIFLTWIWDPGSKIRDNHFRSATLLYSRFFVQIICRKIAFQAITFRWQPRNAFSFVRKVFLKKLARKKTSDEPEYT